MNGLFLLNMNNFLTFLSTKTLAIICNSLVAYLTVLCSIVALKKSQYGVVKRLWVIFDFVGICLVQYWFEMQIDKQITYLILTVGSCFLGLSICLFLPVKQAKISQEKRALAQFLDRCAHNQNSDYNYNEKTSNCLQDEKDFNIDNRPLSVIKANNSDNKSDVIKSTKNQEIDFSHIKGILAKLEYYPLKEQDKKSAKELEKAILEAEQNGLDKTLKQNINEGLGALLKIMAKYAV